MQYRKINTPMNINTLLEIVQTTIQDKNFHGTLRNTKRKYGSEPPKQIGRGAYSTASTDPKDPHMIRKHHNSPLAAEFDPFSDWVKFLVDNNHLDNPHFPKFYNIKKITDKTGSHIYSFTMEKLQSLRDKNINTEILYAIAERDFTDPDDIFEDVSRDDSVESIAYEVASKMGDIMKKAVMQDDPSGIKSESLLEALTIVKQYYEDNKQMIEDLYADIHGGNIMYRRGPHGFTLVITDPFSGRLP